MGVAAELAARLAPDIETTRALSAGSNVVPVALRYIDDTETPVSALLKLRRGGPCFLLESAERGQVGRYSFVGASPHRVIRWSAGKLREFPGEATSGEGDALETIEAPDPYEGVKEYLSRYRVAETDRMPPFAGGAVGLFGYDLVRAIEPLAEPNPDPLGLPDLALMITDVLLAFDHLHNELTIISCAWLDEHETPDEAWESAASRIESVLELLRGPVPVQAAAAAVAAPEFTSNLSREEFERIVARIVEYIHAGDAFQVVPSQRFTAEQRADALSIYRGLRSINPSPYMYFFEFGDFQIAGASPEPLLKVNGDRVEIRPIAGTSPRGSTEEEDRRLAEKMISDPKERAEHVMLVDLARNDIGREAEYGTVEVEELMVVETYSHVMHIVSRVSGRLPAGRGALDVLRSALPAGTLSGAPKVRAMQIIDEMEPVKRCSYGGAVGYLSWNGDLDTAIHIRTALIKDGEVHIQAGGGTVADAHPEYEYEESVNKAKAMFRAVELACENPDWE